MVHWEKKKKAFEVKVWETLQGRPSHFTVHTMQKRGKHSEQTCRKQTWLTWFNLACLQNAICGLLSVCFDMFVL